MLVFQFPCLSNSKSWLLMCMVLALSEQLVSVHCQTLCISSYYNERSQSNGNKWKNHFFKMKGI